MAKSSRRRRDRARTPATDPAPGDRPDGPAAPGPVARRPAPPGMLDWHRAHGANVSRTARHFGSPGRPSIAGSPASTAPPRDPRGPQLGPASAAPPTWTLEQLRAVRAVRERYPRWGKDKLVVLLRRQGLRLSSSMVGRILARLRRSGELREPRLAGG